YLAQPLTSVIGAPLAGLLIQQHGVCFGLEGWRFMYLGVAIPAIAVGVIAWFYLKDDPSEANWLTRCCPHRGWVRGWLVGGPSARCGRGDDYRCGGRRGALRGARLRWCRGARRPIPVPGCG